MTFAEQFEQEFRKHFHVASVRVHEWQPAPYRESRVPSGGNTTYARKTRAVDPGSWRAQIIDLLRKNPDGLCVADLCQATGMDIDQCASKMITMCLSGEIVKDPVKRLIGIGKRSRFVYKLGRV